MNGDRKIMQIIVKEKIEQRENSKKFQRKKIVAMEKTFWKATKTDTRGDILNAIE